MDFPSWIRPLSQSLDSRHQNLGWLNFSLFFRQMAARLTAFYLPLFLFQRAPGIDFIQGLFPVKTQLQQGLILVAAFFFIERLMVMLFSIPIAQLTIKLGHARTFVIGDLIFALTAVSLARVDDFSWLLFPAAIMSGLKISFFWQSYRTLVDRMGGKKKVGKTAGVRRMLNNIVAMLSPAVGGVIIQALNFSALFYVGLIFLLLAVIGHLNLKLNQELDEVNWQEYFSWLKENRFKQLFISQAGKMFNSLALMLWPLYIFLLLGDVTKVGIIYSISLLISIIINYFLGDFLDKSDQGKATYFLSGGVLSVLTIFKIWAMQVWHVVIVDSLDRMIGSFHWVVYDKIIMARGIGSQDFSYFVYRMINQAVASFVFWGLFLIFFLIVPIGWKGVFIVGSLGALLSLLAREKKD